MSSFRVQKVTKVQAPQEFSASSESPKLSSSRRRSAQEKTPAKGAKPATPLKKPTAASSSTPSPASRTGAQGTTKKGCPTDNGKNEKIRPAPGAGSGTKTQKPPVSKTRPTSGTRKSAGSTNTTTTTPSKPTARPRTKAMSKTASEKTKNSETSGQKPAQKPKPAPSSTRRVSPPLANGEGLDFSDFQAGGFRSRDEDDGPRSQRDSGIGRQSSCESNEMLNDLGAQEEYAYATSEFRPLVITDNYGISSAVNTKKKVENPSSLRESTGYVYAGPEFRPLIVTDEGAVSGPVNYSVKKGSDGVIVDCTDSSFQKPSRKNKQFTQQGYEEVQIFSGSYDKENALSMADSNGNEIGYKQLENGPQSVVKDDKDDDGGPCETNIEGMYTKVEKKNKTKKCKESFSAVDEEIFSRNSNEDLTNKCVIIIDENTYSEDEYAYDSDDERTELHSENSSVTHHEVNGDMYAIVQKTKQEPENRTWKSPVDETLNRTVDTTDVSPRTQKRMYDSITYGLQSMIEACHDIDGKMLSHSLSSPVSTHEDVHPPVMHGSQSDKGCNRKAPPPKPKPYHGPGPSEEEKSSLPVRPDHLEIGDSHAEYAVVQKKSKTTSVEKLPAPDSNVDTEDIYSVAPPLPARSKENIHSLSSEDLTEEPKEKKSAFQRFKKKHQRQRSLVSLKEYVSLDRGKGEEKYSEQHFVPITVLENSDNKCTNFKKSHRRTKSHDDLNILAQEVPHVEQLAHFSESMERKVKEEKTPIVKPLVEAYYVADVPVSPPLQPYLVSDIPAALPCAPRAEELFGQPESGDSPIPTRRNLPDQPSDLPEGWMEVKDDTGTYYWHVASGTTQWEKPELVHRIHSNEEHLKPQSNSSSPDRRPSTPELRVLSFPVHSMGWVELEEKQVAPHNMSDTISECISFLASKRHDLWNTTETWGEGKDVRLLLEGDTLKIVEPRGKQTLLIQPVSKMRVWGVGKEDHRDFAFVARDQSSGKHKCHMFRCHGNISGRSVANALHEMCNRILEEKKRAKENAEMTAAKVKPWSDILNTPPPTAAKEAACFNEKPYVEPKKSYSARYFGIVETSKPTGIDVLNKAISKATARSGNGQTCLVEITVSSIKVIDCHTQNIVTEDRVRFISFIGVGKDERLCGYIVNDGQDTFICHIFLCSPNCASLTKALEEACRLRFQKCLDARPELAHKMLALEQDRLKSFEVMGNNEEGQIIEEKESEKDKVDTESDNGLERDYEFERERERHKGGFFQGFWGKLGQKKNSKKEEETKPTSTTTSSNIFLVKYYGALPVAIGTGADTIQEAAKHLSGGTLLICQMEVSVSGVTLYDSQRSPLSRRHIDADNLSYCGTTNDKMNFGVIESQGGGKYICHVFAEYKTHIGPILALIQESM